MPSSRNRRRHQKSVDGCIIPGPLPSSLLGEFVLDSREHEKQGVVRYMKSQAPDQTVRHVEKVASERIYGRKHDVWDVHTNAERWWVITSPTNLYSQSIFQSLDFALSFHIGLMARVMARPETGVSNEERDRLSGAWRRWIQAADALNKADEAEEFQTVGMRCRECLLAFIREVASEEMVPIGQSPPKRADFVQWSGHVADTIARGASSERIRAHLKSVAKSTWELVGWLTHAANATRFDAQLVVDTTQHVLAAFSMALVKFERGAPDRCPECSSYRLASVYRPELTRESPYVTLCEACGWEDLAEAD
jgi:hypothetical protein